MKLIRSLALLTVLALLLAACSGPGREPAATGSTAPSGPDASTPAPASTEPADTEPAPETETELTPPEPLPPESGTLPDLAFAEPAEPRPAADAAEVLHLLADYDYAARWAFYDKSHPEPGGDEPALEGDLEDPAAQALPEGVLRGGRNRTDGAYLYLLDSYGLSIQSAAGADSVQLSYVMVDRNSAASADLGSNRELYVLGDRVAVVYTRDEYGTDENGNWYDRTETHAAIFDVTDRRAPRLLCDRGIDGGYLDSRLVDGVLYLITNEYFWEVPGDMDPEAVLPRLRLDGQAEPVAVDHVLLCQAPNSTALTGVLAIDLTDGAVVDAWVCTDVTMTLFVDADALYLARSVWSSAESEPRTEGIYTVTDSADRTLTEIKRLRRNEDGTLTPDGVCWVPGAPACASALQVADGKLWVMTRDERSSFSTYTDPEQGWSNDRPGVCLQSNRLTVLDEDLQPLGSLEDLAEGRTVVAWSIQGETGWVRCFAEEQALCLLDLSDPAAPAETGTLEPGGWSWLLRPCGEDRAVTLTGSPNGDLTLTVYAAGPGSLEPTGAQTLEDPGQSVLYEPAGFWTDPQLGRAGIPVQRENGFGYAILDLRDPEPKLVTLTELDYLPASAESLLIDGFLYLCSPGSTYVLDPESGELITTISNAEG